MTSMGGTMDYLDTNRSTWDKRTDIHVASKFYNVAGFLAGATSLKEIELQELTDVEGKELLHLQCHFGLDTLSWARRGARVTGVDLSPRAIEKARELSVRSGLSADFVCADVYGFGDQVEKKFDIVFTSYGAVCWLPRLDRWAQTIARCLKPGAIFYMVEFHPIYDLMAGYSYFHQQEPDIEVEGTYTENCDGEVGPTVVWSHPISDVINALLAVGIELGHVREFPFSPYDCFDGMVERGPGRFFLDHGKFSMPLVYSIKGQKP